MDFKFQYDMLKHKWCRNEGKQRAIDNILLQTYIRGY